MAGVPDEHWAEENEPHAEGQVRSRSGQPVPQRPVHDQEQQHARRQEDRVILAEHRAAPREAHPDPGPGPSRLLESDAQAVDGQQPEEEQWPVRQSESRCRQPVVTRQVERQGGEESGARTVPSTGDPPHQPGGRGEECDESRPQGHPGKGCAREGQPGCLDPGQHRRMIVIAQVGMNRVKEVVRLIVAQPQCTGGDQPEQARDHDQDGEGTFGGHRASLL